MDDAKNYCRHAYDEAYQAERYADSAETSFKREVCVLENNLRDLELIKSNMKYKLNSLEHNVYNAKKKTVLVECKIDVLAVKQQLISKKDELTRIEDRAGTPWYKEVGSKQAAQLRKEIVEIERKIK